MVSPTLRHGVVDVFAGLKLLALLAIFGLVSVFWSNVATAFMVYMAPLLVLVAYPVKALGYHNSVMGFFLMVLFGRAVLEVYALFRSSIR